MDAKKNRTFLIVIVTIIVIGLVAAYAPLLFAPPPLYKEPPAPPQSADLREVFPPLAMSAPTSTPRADAAPVPQGFSGLSEEGQSLKDLDSLLGN